VRGVAWRGVGVVNSGLTAVCFWTCVCVVVVSESIGLVDGRVLSKLCG
jgi:hypothetical protein